MTAVPFFNTPDAKQRALSAGAILMASASDSKRYLLGNALSIIANNAEEFDERCQCNIGWIGSTFLSRLGEIQYEMDESKLDLTIAMAYRFIFEFDMSMKNDLSFELRAFMKLSESEGSEISGEARDQVRFARQAMPIAILKRLLNSEELGPLVNVTSIAATVEGKITKWEADLNQSEQKAVQLRDTLEKQAQAFNFVGLHKGFSDLSEDVTSELRFAQAAMVVFGLLTMLPSSVDLWLVLVKQMDLSKTPANTLIAALVSTATITLLFLYFFRIALRKADSCRAQLVQVRLRMSLCRFIQSYAEYSADIKGKNSDALSKFEALIFSGIVGTEDKLPSTFDGIEQLSSLAKSLRGGGK